MFSFTRSLTASSLPAYAAWRLQGRMSPVALHLRNGPRILLRPSGAPNNDYGVAYEVFVLRFYDLPESMPVSRVRTIVDMGANVGFTSLHWLW